jgi:HEAT repeat protein
METLESGVPCEKSTAVRVFEKVLMELAPRSTAVAGKLVDYHMTCPKWNLSSAIAQVGEAAVPTLREYLEYPDPDLRNRALRIVQRLGSAAGPLVPCLQRQFGEARGHERRQLLQVWCDVDTVSVIPTLIDVATDLEEDVELRRSAILMLSRLGPDAAPAAQPLTVLMRSGSERICQAATVALGELAFEPKISIPALMVAAADTAFSARRSAVRGLGKFGAPAAQLIPLLCSLLHDPKVGSMAAAALEEIGLDTLGVVEEISAAVTTGVDEDKAYLDHTPQPRCWHPNSQAYIDAVIAIRPCAIVPMGLSLADHDNPEIRELGLRALHAVREKCPIPAAPIRAILTEESPKLRKSAIRILSDLDPPEAETVSALLVLLADPDENTRSTARKALTVICNRCPGFLADMKLALNHPDPVARVEAIQAIGQCRLRAGPALQGLVAALADSSAQVRDAAIHVLRRLKHRHDHRAAQPSASPAQGGMTWGEIKALFSER